MSDPRQDDDGLLHDAEGAGTAVTEDHVQDIRAGEQALMSDREPSDHLSGEPGGQGSNFGNGASQVAGDSEEVDLDDADVLPSEEHVDPETYEDLSDLRTADPQMLSFDTVAEEDEENPLEVRVSVAGRTDVGLVRDHNEDNYVVADLRDGEREPLSERGLSRAGVLFAVCDGMGGAAAGEVASQMAVDTVLEVMQADAPAEDRDGFARSLVKAIEQAGARIFESAADDRSRRGMGTTSTVAALMDKVLFVGQVGDSRAYVLRAGELKQLTKDQSLVNQLIEAGQLTEAEAEAFEHSNIILQALGTTDQVSVDLTFLELRRGDRLMLCSDGLSGLVHGDVIRDVMDEYRDLDSCCDRLIELAKAGGGHDNVTVILVDFDGESLDPPGQGDLVGYQQYPLPVAEGEAEDPDTDNVGSGSAEQAARTRRETAGLGAEGASSGRFVAIFLLLLVVAVAVYYWKTESVGQEMDTQAEPFVEPPPVEPQPVEVVVRTDVKGGVLYVDGVSYGQGDSDRWQLDLAPGPHRLEAWSDGNVVASSLVTLRDGIPATVFLSIPELSDGQPGAEVEKVPDEAPGEVPRDGPANKKVRKRPRTRTRSSRDAISEDGRLAPGGGALDLQDPRRGSGSPADPR